MAWILLLTYFIWLGVIGRVGCGPDGDELHRLVLGVAPFALCGAFLLRATRPLGDVHAILRWGAVPLALLLPTAVFTVWKVFAKVWLAQEGLCRADSAATWEQLWPLAQAAVIAVVAFLVLANWRTRPAAMASETDA